MNTNIALGYRPMEIKEQESPLNALARVLKVGGMMDEQQANALSMQEKRTGMERQNKLSGLLQGGADPAALRNAGFLKESLDWDEKNADLGKKKADAAKVELEMGLKKAEHGASLLSLAKDPASYAAIRGVWKAQVGTDLPEQYDPTFVQATIAQGQTITQRLEAQHRQMTLAETSRHNGATERNASGQLAVAQSNLDVSRERLKLDQNAPKGVYDGERGVLVDPRTGVATKVTQDGAPIGPKDKALNEGQAKANLFGTRMQEADAVLSKMAAEGVKRPGAIKGVAETVGNIVGLGTDSLGGALSDAAGSLTNWTQSDGQQQVEQAQRDFINADLRRESGASIAAGEFRNANKQYFPQPGDSDEVLAQKARNRKLATQGILAEVPDNKRTKVAPEGSWDNGKEQRYQEWKKQRGAQ